MGWLVVVVALAFGKRILSSLMMLGVLAVVLVGGYMYLSSSFDLGAFDASWLLDQFRTQADRFLG